MNQLLNKAVELLEQLELDILNNNTYITPPILELVNEFLDDYYAEVSFLNENFSKAVNGELKEYMIASNCIEGTCHIININSNRTYSSVYKREGEEILEIIPFKETDIDYELTHDQNGLIENFKEI